MSYINKLREKIKEYEIYIKEFPDQKLIFRLMCADLKTLENEYFKEAH